MGVWVIDVIGYLEMLWLLFVVDVFIMDYFLVMFDFSVIGKLMYFFVFDFDYYCG